MPSPSPTSRSISPQGQPHPPARQQRAPMGFQVDTLPVRSTLLSILAERAAQQTQHAKVTVPESHGQVAYHNIVTVANECLTRLLAPPRPQPFPMSPIEIDHLLFPSGLTMRLRDQVVVGVDQLTKVVQTALELRAFEQSLPRPLSSASTAGSGSSISRSGTLGRRALPPVPPPPTYAATVRQLPGQFQGSGHASGASPVTAIGRRSASLFGLDSITSTPTPSAPPPQTPTRLSTTPHAQLHQPSPSSPLSHLATSASSPLSQQPRDASSSVRSLTGSPVVSLAPYRPSTPVMSMSTNSPRPNSPPVFRSPPPPAGSPLRSQSPLPGGVLTQSPMRPGSALRVSATCPPTVVDLHSHSVMLPLLHTSSLPVPPSPSAPALTVAGTAGALSSTRTVHSQPLTGSDETLSGNNDGSVPLTAKPAAHAPPPPPASQQPTQKWAIPARTGPAAPSWATVLLVIVPVALLALCIVLDGGLMPVSTNPWLGPAPTVLVRWGARAVQCMRPPAASGGVSAETEAEAMCGPLAGAPFQWWRWITAGFVARGGVQVMLTSVMVARFGKQVEKSFGFLRTMVVFLVGNVGGLVASALLVPGALETGANAGAFALFSAAFIDHLAHWSVLASPLADLCKWILGAFVALALGWLLPFVDNTLHVVGWILGVLLALVLRPRVQLVVAAPRLAASSSPTAGAKLLAHSRSSSLASSAAVLVTVPAMSLLAPWQRALVRSVDVVVRLVALGLVVACMYIGLALFYDFGGFRDAAGRMPGGAVQCRVCRYLNWSTWPI